VLGTVTNNIGLTHAGVGEWTEAVRWYERSLATKKRIGDVHGQAVTLNNLGVAFERLGQLDKVQACYEEAVALFKQVGDRVSAAGVLINLSQPPIARGMSCAQRLAFLDEAEALVAETDAQERRALVEQLKARLSGENEEQL
jgi:tetratricopeptide (TPR) repeat protein